MGKSNVDIKSEEPIGLQEVIDGLMDEASKVGAYSSLFGLATYEAVCRADIPALFLVVEVMLKQVYDRLNTFHSASEYHMGKNENNIAGEIQSA